MKFLIMLPIRLPASAVDWASLQYTESKKYRTKFLMLFRVLPRFRPKLVAIT